VREKVYGVNWQPIKTAPRDGTRILAAFEEGVCVIWWALPEIETFPEGGYRYTRREGGWETEGPRMQNPLVWMPLPIFLTKGLTAPRQGE
jgi:hypothetical protein